MDRKDRMRLKITEALLSLLRDSPIQEIYIVDLIEEAGVSKRTFYNYFSDKHDALFWWWKYQMAPYLDANSKDFTIQQLQLLKKHSASMSNALCYTGQNNFFEDVIAYDMKNLRRHVHKDILKKYDALTAFVGVEFTTRSGWSFIVNGLGKPMFLDNCIAALKADPDAFILGGSLSIIVPYFHYEVLPKGKHL